jgi:phosphate transport system substrate-binding protein
MKKFFVLVLVALSAVAFAGGNGEGSGADWAGSETIDGIPVVNPLAVTGNIVTAGSSTVFPLSERMVERFTEDGYKGTITVDSIGSGAGFERFTVAGETDISNASRPSKLLRSKTPKKSAGLLSSSVLVPTPWLWLFPKRTPSPKT